MEMKPAHFSRENLPANFQFIERKKNGKGREGRERLPRSHSDRVNYERFKPRFLRWSVGSLLPLLAPSFLSRVYQRFVIVASTHMGSEVAAPTSASDPLSDFGLLKSNLTYYEQYGRIELDIT